MDYVRKDAGSPSSSTRYLRDGDERSAPMPKKGRRAVLWLFFLAVGLLVASAVSAAVLVKRGKNKDSREWRKPTQAISMACTNTMYQSLCIQSLMDFQEAKDATSADDLVHLSFNMTLQHLNRALYLSTAMSASDLVGFGQSAYDDCVELLEDSIEALTRSLSIVSPSSSGSSGTNGNVDVMTWLSAALTNQETCTDGLNVAGGKVMYTMKDKLSNLSELISNCLAIFAATGGNDFDGIPIGNKRKLMAEDEGGLPGWLRPADRRLLQMPASAIQADMVVSKDGNGSYTSIADAIKQVPEWNPRRIVIYIKAGRYEEDILKVGRKKTNVMIIGDGKGLTFISGGKSIFNNITTFGTAAFAATGAGFIARDITFENWAGPGNHQAVALRVGADHAVIYRCNIIGYQDTLYVHSNRQFYRECDVYGTVDFIFGNAAVVFQNCSIYARKPLPFQKNTITAQSRKDPNQNTGMSIHACRILATSDLEASKGSFETFLGRPWKQFARTVYMMSYIGDHVQPRGWLEWNATSPVDALYYAEYSNYGPGSALGQRITWPGYHVLTSAIDAAKFTVSQFIYGSSWLPNTGVSYLAGLSE